MVWLNVLILMVFVLAWNSFWVWLWVFKVDPWLRARQAKKTPCKEVTYTYAWGNNSKRAGMKGRPCRILHTLSKGSVYIEFTDDGQREITSRRALRRQPR